MKKPRNPMYRIYVILEDDYWKPVGRFYRTKAAAKGWISFVKVAWHCECRVVHAASWIGGAA